MSEESLLSFPCHFAIKAIGKTSPELDLIIVDIVRRHNPDLKEGAVSMRPSKNGNYSAVTVTMVAHSREQLDAIYQDLNRSGHILMTL